MNSNTSQKKSKIRKLPGRPREHHISCSLRGIVAKSTQDSLQFEEHQGNSKVVSELLFQFPLHLKCISNTIRQIDKNGKLHFVMLPDQVILYYGDIGQKTGTIQCSQNKCYLRIKCQQSLSYFFDFPEQGFIKFSVPISHIANSFAFYNRSSVKTEIRVFGPQKPLMRIDSYKSEKRKLQKITNTISVRLCPASEDVNAVQEFVQELVSNSKSIHYRSDAQYLQQVSSLQSMNQNEQICQVLRQPKLFNDCFFVNYRQLRVYEFMLQNQDIRKFITEVQKDCQTIMINRELQLDSNNQYELRQIVLKSQIPGSGSQKKLENPPSLISNYKQFRELPEELTYNVSANILKQISSNNPNCSIQFIMLDNQAVVLKIRDRDKCCVFKFLVHSLEV